MCVFTQRSSYSTVLLQAGGLLIVMNTQLDRMVIMMSILKYLKNSQGKYGKYVMTHYCISHDNHYKNLIEMMRMKRI